MDYLIINGHSFNSPAIKREGYECTPHIVQVTDEQRVASGKLVMKPLPHQPTKISVTFPVMTIEQFDNYRNIIRGSGQTHEMSLNITYYNAGRYENGIFYHTDIKYKIVKYQGRDMVIMDTISFIEW